MEERAGRAVRRSLLCTGGFSPGPLLSGFHSALSSGSSRPQGCHSPGSCTAHHGCPALCAPLVIYPPGTILVRFPPISWVCVLGGVVTGKVAQTGSRAPADLGRVQGAPEVSHTGPSLRTRHDVDDTTGARRAERHAPPGPLPALPSFPSVRPRTLTWALRTAPTPPSKPARPLPSPARAPGHVSASGPETTKLPGDPCP